MKVAREFYSIVAVFSALIAVVAVPASAQRVQFPSAVPPPPYNVAPSPAVVGPGPTATFDGTIQPPPAQWDPYATPGATPPPLLPQDPYFQYGGPSTVGPQGTTFQRVQKFVQEVRLDYVWMPGNGQKEFGINDIELNVTFAIPFLYNTETPLLVTPGFAINLWNGPSGIDLPPRVYDAYLDAAWNPQATSWFGGELSFRIGAYSDFKKVTNESMRYMGKGMAVLSFSPNIKVKAGMWYLDRNRIKILPAGGLVWTPNPDVQFDILFPNPKFARRLANYGNTEWWIYLRGEYGGGAWTITMPAPIGVHSMDYNDMRCAVGVEFMNQGRLTGLFETGLAFERELYADTGDKFSITSTVFLRGGLAY